MNLTEVKENIVIVGPDTAMNEKVLSLVKRDIDCFGRAYLEEAVECKECIVFAELDGKRMELREFCKDFSGKGVTVEQKVFVEKSEKGGTMVEQNVSEGVSVEGKKKLRGMTELAKDLFSKGKSEEEVISEIKGCYLSQGRNSSFAEKRAKLYADLARNSKDSIPL